jgi:predicted adenylyl cyclase CyaB
MSGDAGKELEIEVKFRIGDPAAIVEKLKAMGATMAEEGFERNVHYDRDGVLHGAGECLRVRECAGRADITHKRKVKDERFKVREETIVVIDSFERGKKLLERLGFRPVWRYEKRRQIWETGKAGVCVDEMPFIGNFIEIEAGRDAIVDLAAKLGLGMEDAITATYRDLFAEYCRKKGTPLRDMVFGEETS